MSDPLIPKGVAHLPFDEDAAPERVTFLLLPNLSMLAFTSAIEPLRMANQITGKALYEWRTISENGQQVRCSNGVKLLVDGGLDDPIPGGSVFVCSGVEPETSSSQRAADWIRRQWRMGRHVGGLCTGAYTLAKAGILEGRTFTLHWENLAPFRETYPELTPREQIYAIDDRIMTCGGGAAATDLFLSLIYQRYGAMLCQSVLNMCLHSVHRPETEKQRASTSAGLGVRNQKLTGIINYLDQHLEEDLALDDVAEMHAISRRQLERLFKDHVGVSPKRYLLELRLLRGRSLLAETDMSVIDVSVACGFNSPTTFSKRFREYFGTSPYAFSVVTG